MLVQNESSLIQVSNQDSQLVVDSRLIAAQLEISHKAFLQTIRKYQAEMEQDFERAAFETALVQHGGNGAQKEVVSHFWLNEDQALYLMSLSRNTDAVRKCKRELVKAFSQAKKIIPKQNERIREFELQAEIMRRQDNRIALHGLEVAMMLEGKSEKVAEVDRPTIEIIDGGVKYVGQTLPQVKETAFKKFGIKFKSGADIKRFLEACGAEGLIGQTPRKVLTDYIPLENLEEVYKVLKNNGNLQLLLGQ